MGAKGAPVGKSLREEEAKSEVIQPPRKRVTQEYDISTPRSEELQRGNAEAVDLTQARKSTCEIAKDKKTKR